MSAFAVEQGMRMPSQTAALDYRDWPLEKKINLWRMNPINGNVRIRVPQLPEILMYSENDDSVVKELWWTNFRGWELTTLHVWFALAEKAGGAVLDIGSYSGIFSVYASLAAPDAKVFAFEPQQRAIERVRKNLELNKVKTAEAVHGAVADKNGTVILHFYEKPDIISSIASIHASESADCEVEIRSICLDDSDFLKRPVSLIKIDVEGAETQALQGMRKLIATDKPDIVIEANDLYLVDSYREFLPEEYSVFAIDDENQKIQKLGDGSTTKQIGRNYLLTPRSKSDLTEIFNPYGSMLL